jgi:flagellar biosynthetic protein FliR
MDWLRLLDPEKFVLFTLVLTRVSGLFVTAPVFGTTEAPATVRALLSFALTLLLMPTQWGASLALPAGLGPYVLAVGAELLVGMCLGMGLVILLAGIQMAGELISRIGGLTLSDIFDPTVGDNVPLFSKLLSLISTAVFMLIGGHRVVLRGLLDTFHTIPPGGSLAMVLGHKPIGDGNLLPSLADMFVVLTTQSFSLGIRASMPIVTAVLLATLVLGLIGRTLPQLNVLVLGFGLNAMLTFGILAVSLGAMVLVFQEGIEPALRLMFETLHVPIYPM